MMKRTFPVILAVVIALGALFSVILQAGTASACHQGLTPGYWKNHTELWPQWGVGHSPDCHFETVFGVDVPGMGPDVTLLQVLQTGGGKWKALNRHAVAALCNSYAFDPDWYSPGTVIGMVQEAYADGEWESLKDFFEENNELGLNGD
jgi:hypothetical protein